MCQNGARVGMVFLTCARYGEGAAVDEFLEKKILDFFE